jgi:exopolysaccharide biosynthesis polyprenyl glycosylphosphotransferase
VNGEAGNPSVGALRGLSRSSAAERTHPRPSWWRDRRRRRLLAIADLTAGALGGLAAAPGDPVVLALAPVWVVLAKLFGLYDRDHKVIRHLTVDEVPYLALWAFAGAALLALLIPATGADSLTALMIGRGAAVAFVAAVALRAAARWSWRSIVPPERTALLGAGELASVTRRKISLYRDMHIDLAVELPIFKLDGEGAAEQLQDLAAQVDRIIVAREGVDSEFVGALSLACRHSETKLSVVSSLRGKALPVPQMTQVADLPVFEYDTWDVPRSTMLLKRCLDLVLSSLGLLLLAPLVPLIALAIKLDDRGPTFFRQRRAGLDGRPFEMVKFRTMRTDAERRLGEVVRFEELLEPMFKVNGDPRITRVGRMLRRLSLDEAPQLWNVLRGEMSIVGPRPEQVEIVERYGSEHVFRLQVKPGMTGPMQVHGRGELTFAERLAVEADYIDNISILRDLRILGLTLPAVIRGTGAY